MLGITDFWTYVVGTAAIVLLPGPNSIYVLSTAARHGVRVGYRAAAGVFLGDAVLMILSAVGIASLLRAYPPVFLVIKYAGAAYLFWVGLGIILGALRGLRARAAPTSGMTSSRPPKAETGGLAHESGGLAHMGPSESGGGSTGRTDVQSTEPAGMGAESDRSHRPFRRATVISLLNPKAILFFVSFFIQFVEPGYAHPALPFLVLGAVLQLFSALYLTALIFGGRYLAGQFQRRRRLAAGAAAGMGAVFVGFGLKLATAGLS
jgi:leucine efflux protein